MTIHINGPCYMCPMGGLKPIGGGPRPGLMMLDGICIGGIPGRSMGGPGRLAILVGGGGWGVSLGL